MTDLARQRILGACFRLMLPIARMLLANGIGYREFDDTCRQAFVQTASGEFGLRGRKTNTSRVAAMTGLPRKQVQDLKKRLDFEAFRSEEMLSPLADLLQRWATADEYRDETGSPIALTMHDSGPNSFSRLVRACMGDLPPGAVRAELLRLGVVGVGDNDELHLRKRSLIPDDVDTRLESAIVYSLTGLAKTIAHNCDPQVRNSDRLFERFVESPPMTESEVSRLRSVLRSRLTQITEDLDSLLKAHSHSDEKDQPTRIGIGIYYCE